MSGLYNVLFGMNPDSDKLLRVIGLPPEDVYRFRDAYLTEAGEVAIHTRGGGGNRECYCYDYAKDEQRTEVIDGEHHHPGCVVVSHDRMRTNPNYLRNEDDDFDYTYATFYFKVPVEAKALLEELPLGITPAEKWSALFAALQRPEQASQRPQGGEEGNDA